MRHRHTDTGNTPVSCLKFKLWTFLKSLRASSLLRVPFKLPSSSCFFRNSPTSMADLSNVDLSNTEQHCEKTSRRRSRTTGPQLMSWSTSFAKLWSLWTFHERVTHFAFRVADRSPNVACSAVTRMSSVGHSSLSSALFLLNKATMWLAWLRTRSPFNGGLHLWFSVRIGRISHYSNSVELYAHTISFKDSHSD